MNNDVTPPPTRDSLPEVPLASPPPTPGLPPQEPHQPDNLSENDADYQPPEPMTQTEVILKAERDGMKNIVSTIVIFIAAPLIALFLITFVFQSYEVDGPSMEATLQNNDRLIVLKLPVTLSKVIGEPYIPNRGDIIVFNRPDGNVGGGEKQLIKRVIGLPGDRVVVGNGKITVFNETNPGGFDPDTTGKYGLSVTTTSGSADYIIGEKEIFVAGDNRVNSLDSRAFGPISSSNIVGKLALRVYPFEAAEQF